MSKNRKKILYIEDEPDIVAIAKIALEDLGGFEVQTYLNGPDGIKAARNFKPDLFIIDVMMPEMDGVTVFKELRKIPDFTETPIIFMTAKTQTSEIEQYMALGAFDVITKPFDPMTLASQVKQVWNESET